MNENISHAILSCGESFNNRFTTVIIRDEYLNIVIATDERKTLVNITMIESFISCKHIMTFRSAVVLPIVESMGFFQN